MEQPPAGAVVPAPPANPAGGRQTSGLAIVSLVAGILGWVMAPFIASVVAVVCGQLARGEIRRDPGRLVGGGIAVAGLARGYAHVLLAAGGVGGAGLVSGRRRGLLA